MVIDENTPGIRKQNFGYIFRGDLEADNLYIRVNLTVTGWIKADGWIKAIESIQTYSYIEAGNVIEVDGSIKANSFIRAGDTIEVSGSIKAGSWIEAGRWIESKSWIEAGGEIIVGNFLRGDIRMVRGIKTTTFLSIPHFWHICILDNHIKIGCEFHTKEKWKSFTDKEIKKMDKDALKFWRKNKQWILSL